MATCTKTKLLGFNHWCKSLLVWPLSVWLLKLEDSKNRVKWLYNMTKLALLLTYAKLVCKYKGKLICENALYAIKLTYMKYQKNSNYQI